MDLAPGTALTTTLRLVRPLAQGAMGSLWVAHDTGRAEDVAVKFVSAKLSERQREALARFRREGEYASKLSSPHIVKTYETGQTDDGTPYIVMELLHGESLGARLEREGQLAPDETARIVHQLAGALTAAHGLGMVHRDIKPDNIYLVTGQSHPYVKVLDFGTVKAPRVRDGSVVTATGVMVGTPEYMSPEQVLGSRDVDHRADLWALGVVAYRALTGVDPFAGAHPHALCLAICMGKFEPATTVHAGLPPELDRWFERALAPDPNDRFTSAQELSAAFSRIALPDGAVLVEEIYGDLAGDIEDEETHALTAGVLASVGYGKDGSTRADGDGPPAATVHAPDGSDDEPTRAFHKDHLRAASGADAEPPASRSAAHGSNERPSGASWWRSAMLVVALAAIAGAAAFGSGVLEPADPAAAETSSKADAPPSAGQRAASLEPRVIDLDEDVVIDLDETDLHAAGGADGNGRAGGHDGVATAAAGGTSGANGSGESGGSTRDSGSASAPPGYLTVVCIPACDQVIALGRALGPSPIIRTKLPAGEHGLTLKRSSRDDKMVTVKVVADQLTTIRVSMAPGR